MVKYFISPSKINYKYFQSIFKCDTIYLNQNKEATWQLKRKQNVLQKPKKESNVRIPHLGNRNSVHLTRKNSCKL